MDAGSKKSGGEPQDHPSLLAYVVGRDGKAFSLLSNGQQYQASSLAKWAVEQLGLVTVQPLCGGGAEDTPFSNGQRAVFLVKICWHECLLEVSPAPQ